MTSEHGWWLVLHLRSWGFMNGLIFGFFFSCDILARSINYPIYSIPLIMSRHKREATREEVCLSGSLLSTADDFIDEAPEQVSTRVTERTGDHAT